MKKIKLIIAREYLTRVKKKSFLIMTVLGPILMASVMIIPVYIATLTSGTKTVGIVDESGFFTEGFKETSSVKFKTLHLDIADAKKHFDRLGIDVLLYIPQPAYTFPSHVILFSKKQPGINVESYIRNCINDDLRVLRLKKEKVSPDILERIKSSIEVNTIKIKDDGSEEESMATRDFILGMVGGIIIYFFIFMYGAQVMRGVIEEKTNRIIEVIISSVKPFQLMMGKIIGLALVGLTQFLLWIILTTLIVGAFESAYTSRIVEAQKQELVQMGRQLNPNDPLKGPESQRNELSEALYALSTINYPLILGGFLFYFLFGYLMYAALFAAIGAAVDNETDTQQFMLPITVPLIITVVMAQNIASDPQGAIGQWLSQIPFTSPIAMMIRLPYGIPVWEVVLSMTLLVAGFVGTTWLAAKIYRIGILSYGKKPSYKEILQWIKMK